MNFQENLAIWQHFLATRMQLRQPKNVKDEGPRMPNRTVRVERSANVKHLDYSGLHEVYMYAGYNKNNL